VFDRYEARIARLDAGVAEFKAQGNQNSQDSSKPPAAEATEFILRAEARWAAEASAASAVRSASRKCVGLSHRLLSGPLCTPPDPFPRTLNSWGSSNVTAVHALNDHVKWYRLDAGFTAVIPIFSNPVSPVFSHEVETIMTVAHHTLLE
jgi:hypothetical protein